MRCCKFAFVEQCDGEAALVAEPPVQRPLSDAGLGGHIVHRHSGHSLRGEQTLRGGEHAQPVAGSVGAFPTPRTRLSAVWIPRPAYEQGVGDSEPCTRRSTATTLTDRS